MRKLEHTTTVHVNISDSVLELFDRQFPSCRRRFIQNALEMANNSKDVFDKIFFKDLLCKNDTNSIL